MIAIGRWRVYFNRHGAAPLVWCVAAVRREEGVDVVAWELAVPDVQFELASLRTVYKPKIAPDDEDGRPSAWLEVEGVLTLSDGGAARITQTDDPSLDPDIRGPDR